MVKALLTLPGLHILAKKRKLLRGFIVTKCLQLFHLKAQREETALGAVNCTLIPKAGRDGAGGESLEYLAWGWGVLHPQAKPHPKFLEMCSVFNLAA